MPLKLNDLGLTGNKKLQKAVLIIGVVLIAVIFISTLLPSGASNEAATLEESLEQRLEAMLSDISGVTKPKVMLTVVSPEGYGGYSADMSFEIRGVTVVCGGAENPVIREKVVEAVAGALGISKGRVCVTC